VTQFAYLHISLVGESPLPPRKTLSKLDTASSERKKWSFGKEQPTVRGRAFQDTIYPLCKVAVSIGHILGSCTHSKVKKVHISRHDKAMGLILKVIQNGSLVKSTVRQMWARLR